MKSTNDYFKEVVYKCDCGCPEFLEFTADISKYQKLDKFEQLTVALISEPLSWWEWIKRCFRKRTYVKEIILNKKDVKELRDYLNSFKL